MGGRFGELLLLLILALILFGPDKLPKIGQALGASLHEFKKASNPQGESQAPQNQQMMTTAAPQRTRRRAVTSRRKKTSK